MRDKKFELLEIKERKRRFLRDLCEISCQYGIHIRTTNNAVWVEEDVYRGNVWPAYSWSGRELRDLDCYLTIDDPENYPPDPADEVLARVRSEAMAPRTFKMLEDALKAHARHYDTEGEAYLVLVLDGSFVLIDESDATVLYMGDFAILEALTGKAVGGKQPKLRSWTPSRF